MLLSNKSPKSTLLERLKILFNLIDGFIELLAFQSFKHSLKFINEVLRLLLQTNGFKVPFEVDDHDLL
jgi:hypothetical protein